MICEETRFTKAKVRDDGTIRISTKIGESKYVNVIILDKNEELTRKKIDVIKHFLFVANQKAELKKALKELK